MNKKLLTLNAVLLPLAVIVGWTLSKATIIGKVGIHVLHREYTFLNSWWKGALLIWIVWLALEIIQYRIWKKYPPNTNRIIQSLLILLAIVGLYFTYLDFRTISHNLLGQRFHIGGYLFWIGWCIISIFFIRLPKDEISINPDAN